VLLEQVGERLARAELHEDVDVLLVLPRVEELDDVRVVNALVDQDLRGHEDKREAK
jgi:hypothetical protein